MGKRREDGRTRVGFEWDRERGDWPGIGDLDWTVTGLPFQTREWIDGWMATLGRAEDAAPVFVVIEDENGAPGAYLPLVRRRRRGLTILEGLGGNTADYQAPLVARGGSFGPQETSLLWAGLTASGIGFDAVALDRAPAGLTGGANPLLAWGARPHRAAGHVARLEGSWDAWFETRFGRETRATLRRKRKKLEGLGNVRTRFAADLGEALAWLDLLVAWKAQRMEEAGEEQANGLADPGMAAFYGALTRSDPELRWVQVYGLLVDGTPVALQWGVAAGRRFTNLLTSHAGGEWGRHSPGLLLFRHLFEHCFEQGYELFDFGLGDEPYKDRFCDVTTPLYDIVKARTMRGRGFVLMQGARDTARRSPIARELRAQIRKLLNRSPAPAGT